MLVKYQQKPFFQVNYAKEALTVSQFYYHLSKVNQFCKGQLNTSPKMILFQTFKLFDTISFTHSQQLTIIITVVIPDICIQVQEYFRSSIYAIPIRITGLSSTILCNNLDSRTKISHKAKILHIKKTYMT